MKNNYTHFIDDELQNLYNEVDYNYDAMFDKDINKELVDLYDELSNEMTFNYDDGPDNVRQRKNFEKSKSNNHRNQSSTSDIDYDDYQEDLPDSKKRHEKKSKSKNNGSKEPLSRNKKVFLGIILTIAIGVFLVSALKLIIIQKGYEDGRKAYTKIDEDFFKGDVDNIEDFDWDFSELFTQNPEVVGYIFSQDLVSYPIVQGADNSYYLKHLFTHEYNDSGSIFMDCNLQNRFESRNCIIYGHNMQDGSMFSKLLNYSKGDGATFYQDHKEFHIFTTDNHHYVYKVIGAYTASISSNLYAIDLNDEQFIALINEVIANTPYETEHAELNAASKIMTLSTCLDTMDAGNRQVIILVRDREIIK